MTLLPPGAPGGLEIVLAFQKKTQELRIGCSSQRQESLYTRALALKIIYKLSFCETKHSWNVPSRASSFNASHGESFCTMREDQVSLGTTSPSFPSVILSSPYSEVRQAQAVLSRSFQTPSSRSYTEISSNGQKGNITNSHRPITLSIMRFSRAAKTKVWEAKRKDFLPPGGGSCVQWVIRWETREEMISRLRVQKTDLEVNDMNCI